MLLTTYFIDESSWQRAWQQLLELATGQHLYSYLRVVPCTYVVSEYLVLCTYVVSEYLVLCTYVVSEYLVLCTYVVSEYLVLCTYVVSDVDISSPMICSQYY